LIRLRERWILGWGGRNREDPTYGQDQVALLRLLGADRIGVSLTEQIQMVPELSTSAIVFLSPHARWFGVGA
jgi:cobalamin-dependent methionine synthase I